MKRFPILPFTKETPGIKNDQFTAQIQVKF